MKKVFRTLGITAGIMLVIAITLGLMAVTKTGFAIVTDGSRGVMKTGTKYDMDEIQPGYHFFIPIYQSIVIDTIRPKLINYSRTEGNKEDSELLIFEPVLKGLDKKGIPVALALSIEVKPVANQLAEMYKNDGDFENAFYKKVKQVNRDSVQFTISKFSVDTIMDHRAEVEKTLTEKLTKSYAKNPYFKLVNINLKDIIVPRKISEKMLEVQAAKQDALKSQELIKKAQNEAKARAAKAQGEAEAVKIAAEGRAEALLVEATSQAKANDLLSKSLTEKVIRIQTIEKWDGSVPTYVGGEKSQFIMKMK
jgi:regulator of protease activity HflC (stomatin/prohibitin superfamily)